jgi:acyl carrier protein
MNVIDIIKAQIIEVAEITDTTINTEFSENTVLLESGLDSLGFAILVAKLEEEFDVDPFADAETAVYPTTFGEFVSIYEKVI